MARIPKKVICLATVAVIFCAHVPEVHAEALPNVFYGSSTIADIVMSYYAMGGAAVANTDWINTLYDSLGSNFGTIKSFAENGYLVTNPDGTWYATQALEQAIENAPAYQSLGLDKIFNVSAQEAAAGGGLAASTGAATLAGATGAVGSVGVLPLLGGVTAAYWGGIGIGTIIAHMLGLYDKPIESGNKIVNNTNFDIASMLPDGAGYLLSTSWFQPPSLYYMDNTKATFVTYRKNSNQYVLAQVFHARSANQHNGTYHYYYGGSDHTSSVNFTNGIYYTYSTIGNIDYDMGLVGASPIIRLQDESEFNTYINGLSNGTLEINPFSPDMIGENGNLDGEYDPDSGKYQVPYMLPQVDPSVQSGQPLTMEDWLRFANDATGNNSDPDGKTKNKKLFDDILDAIKKGVPSTPDPDPDPDPDPYHPPTPTPVPDPDYGDPNPDQPEFESETDVPDPVDTGNPWVTPDLLDKFPFCIPKDMVDMIKGFKSADRTAPHISWNFKSPVGHVDYTFNLDLEDFEDVATLLRALELAAFIVGLAFTTRYLIGAS